MRSGKRSWGGGEDNSTDVMSERNRVYWGEEHGGQEYGGQVVR